MFMQVNYVWIAFLIYIAIQKFGFNLFNYFFFFFYKSLLLSNDAFIRYKYSKNCNIVKKNLVSMWLF